MLVKFSVKNFKSFNEEVVLSMAGSSLKETYQMPAQAIWEISNSLSLVPIAAIYGANASGKSNLIEAMTMMRFFVQTSLSRENVQDKIPVEPFLLSTKTEHEGTEFEISFIASDKLFRYGFVASKEVVSEEWLYEKELKERGKEKELFHREGDILEYHSTLFKVGKIIKDQNLAKASVLVFTLAYQLNDETAREAMQWFINFNTLLGHKDENYVEFSSRQITEHSAIEEEMQKLIRFADTNINKLSFDASDRQEIITHHTKFNENKEAVGEMTFILSKQQSEGTKKLFNLSGPILHTLKYGGVLVLDELDCKLHPNLLEILVRMFQDKSINTRRAQLIFATHNTNLLSAKLLRRDQVWITEKNQYGATQLYSIADYKAAKGKARNTEAIEQNYIEGKYGGVPFLGDLENFLEQYYHEQGAA